MYKRPGWLTLNVLNAAITGTITRLGRSPRGSQLLTVWGRRSGQPRSVPVNPLTFEGGRYLVAPRGETEWVKNLRASREGSLRVGSRPESFRAKEVADTEKPPIIRAYLQRWQMETKIQFGVGADATPEELTRIAPNHPVFRLLPASETAPPLPR
ncbi:MAG: nitroreductase family deazaflavin-dependent oxidoreductase [Chloroflexota bacterium]|nr:nitroreductase family deazaflavin-dependent oxidoreductase [Chloroflexota bacterium]